MLICSIQISQKSLLTLNARKGEVPCSLYTSSSSGFIGAFAPHSFMTTIVLLVSNDEIEEIVLIYRILAIFKAYPCDENQKVDGEVAK